MAEGERLRPEEWLYRTLTDENVDGDRILEEAIEMPDCSFDRSAMTTPEEVLARRPQEPRLMEVQVSALPPPIPRKVKETSVMYELAAIHRPKPENLAHSQVELTPLVGDRPRRLPPEFRSTALSALAAKIRVRPLVPPEQT